MIILPSLTCDVAPLWTCRVALHGWLHMQMMVMRYGLPAHGEPQGLISALNEVSAITQTSRHSKDWHVPLYWSTDPC